MKWHLGQALDQVAHCMARANRHRALHYNGLWLSNWANLLKRTSNVPRDSQHILQVRAAVFIAWCTDANEDGLGILVRSLLVEREVNTPGLNVARQHLRETRLIDRALAALEFLNLPRINIKAGHLIAGLCKARTRNESNVSSANHGEFHNSFDSVCVFRSE